MTDFLCTCTDCQYSKSPCHQDCDYKSENECRKCKKNREIADNAYWDNKNDFYYKEEGDS